jgi:hypothetical protein
MTFARVRALIVVAVLFITAGVVVIMAIGRDTQTSAGVQDTCDGTGLVPAKIKMPEKRGDVVLNVINGTGKVGLAEQVSTEFQNRGFKVNDPKSQPPGEPTDEIAIVRFGPEAIGKAWYVSAFFLVDEAKMELDLKRKGAEVDIVVGSAFQQLATTTEVNQSIAAIGNPTLPKGTCQGAE